MTADFLGNTHIMIGVSGGLFKSGNYTIAGLNKKIAPEANVYNVFDLASLEAIVEALKGELIGA